MGSGAAVAVKEVKGKKKEQGEMEQIGRVVTELPEFIDAAEHMGNYPTNTAGGFKAALRLVSSVLTDEEASSLDTFRRHLEPIFQRVFNKNKSRVSAVSLKVYRGRINTVLSDYEQYGRDPQAMASWKRKGRAMMPRRSSQHTETKHRVEEGEQGELVQGGPAMNRHELSLRPNAKAILLIPSDLTKAESVRIKTLLDACVMTE